MMCERIPVESCGVAFRKPSPVNFPLTQLSTGFIESTGEIAHTFSPIAADSVFAKNRPLYAWESNPVWRGENPPAATTFRAQCAYSRAVHGRCMCSFAQNSLALSHPDNEQPHVRKISLPHWSGYTISQQQRELRERVGQLLLGCKITRR